MSRSMPNEVTHLRCADCDEVFAIEDLSLQLDGRRTCDACSQQVTKLTKQNEAKEADGQERLFSR